MAMAADGGQRVRRLIVLRHAKADWPAGIPDKDRPLATRGRRDAAAVGRWLAEHIGSLDLVVHSDARRTTETCQLVLGAWPGDGVQNVDVRGSALLYEAGVPELIDALHSLPDQAKTALLIGHNPGVQELVLNLARSDDGAGTALATAKFPTSGLAVLDITGSWSRVTAGGAHLEEFVVARG